jgi:hypothetical protein
MKKKSTTKLLHEHVRYYSKEEISSKLAQAGFEIKESHITYGHYGRYAYDIVTLVQYNRFFKLFFPFYFVFIHPYVMLLMWVDLIAENKTGNGLLVLAQKKD